MLTLCHEVRSRGAELADHEFFLDRGDGLGYDLLELQDQCRRCDRTVFGGSVALALFISKKTSQEKLSSKWFFYISIAFLGNTGCTILQKTQQMQYHNQHGNMLMFFAMIPAVVVCALLYHHSPAQQPTKILRKTGFMPVLSGSLNLLLNFFIILLAAGSLSPSLIYPTTAVGGICVTCVLSRIIFKERLSLRQWIGVAVGALAIVLLSI